MFITFGNFRSILNMRYRLTTLTKSLQDICFFKGNVIVVDTPGFGDKKQENVAQLMLEYLPNALAIVFVINVQSAGGIQDDRVRKLLLVGCLNTLNGQKDNEIRKIIRLFYISFKK